MQNPPSPHYGMRSPDGQFWWNDQAWVPLAPSAPPPYYPAPTRTNGMAVAALVCSLAGLFVGFTAIIGIILGFIARNEIKASQGRQTGDGLALAAIIIGFIITILGILLLIGIVVALSTMRADIPPIPSGFSNAFPSFFPTPFPG